MRVGRTEDGGVERYERKRALSLRLIDSFLHILTASRCCFRYAHQSTGSYLKPLSKNSEEITKFLIHFNLMANPWIHDTFVFTSSSMILYGAGFGVGIVAALFSSVALVLLACSITSRQKDTDV